MLGGTVRCVSWYHADPTVFWVNKCYDWAMTTALAPDELAALSRMRVLVHTGAARHVRERAGISVAEMAAACGVNRLTVRRWESGENAPRGGPAVRYAAALDSLTGAR